MASPTAKYNEPKSIFDAPCDVVLLCAKPNELTPEGAEALAASGCKTVVDGGYRPVSSAAAKVGYRTRTVKRYGVSNVRKIFATKWCGFNRVTPLSSL